MIKLSALINDAAWSQILQAIGRTDLAPIIPGNDRLFMRIDLQVDTKTIYRLTPTQSETKETTCPT